MAPVLTSQVWDSWNGPWSVKLPRRGQAQLNWVSVTSFLKWVENGLWSQTDLGLSSGWVTSGPCFPVTDVFTRMWDFVLPNENELVILDMAPLLLCFINLGGSLPSLKLIFLHRQKGTIKPTSLVRLIHMSCCNRQSPNLQGLIQCKLFLASVRVQFG